MIKMCTIVSSWSVIAPHSISIYIFINAVKVLTILNQNEHKECTSWHVF